MKQQRVTVAGHEVPEWARCYCVKRHHPSYVSVLPYEIFEGRILYLCPASHHALTLFLKMCEMVGGAPEFNPFTCQYPHVVEKLGRLVWAVRSGAMTEEQYMRAETVKRMMRRVDG
jgi:hypothetical protein